MFDAHYFHVLCPRPNLGILPCGTSRGILECYKVETEEALQEIIPRQVRLEPAEIGRREERKRKDAEVVGGEGH